MFYCNYLTHLTVLCVVIVLDKDENVSENEFYDDF